jgi:succinate dehydrogenase / fumarate reductase, membrane anchor subunit
MNLRSPLGRARGLGSSRSGSDHYWAQRVTALALVPLVLWFVISLITVTGGDLGAVKAWLARPFNATLLLLTLLTGIWHGMLGLQVILEDYVHSALTKHFLLIFIRLIAAFLAISVAISTLKLALGG